jgi:hypothetical protein
VSRRLCGRGPRVGQARLAYRAEVDTEIPERFHQHPVHGAHGRLNRPPVEAVELPAADVRDDVHTEQVAVVVQSGLFDVEWRAEVSRLGLNSAKHRLPMAWTVSGARSTGGQGQDLADFWVNSPSRRIVLLGDLGSGKIELLYQLVSSLLDRRQPGGKVPVLIPAASWDPTRKTFAQWIGEWLATSYSFLSPHVPGPAKVTIAEALLDEGRLAIVLDGLDELPPDLARLAVRKLSTELDRTQYLLVSSRTTEFENATVEGPLEGAVTVTLDAQDPSNALRYLREHSHGESARWDEVPCWPVPPLSGARPRSRLSCPLWMRAEKIPIPCSY